MLMDIVEVVHSHSGFNLALAFAKILEEYGIRDKINIFFIEIEHDELTRHAQIFSITCDNASNNNTMIKALAELIDDFPGAANQMCCFLHILNLVLKSIIKQFDLPESKKKSGGNDDNGNDERLDQATEELLRMAGNIDLEEEMMENNDEDEDNNNEGWIGECEEMTVDELGDLATSVAPVRLLLTKVRLKYINLL